MFTWQIEKTSFVLSVELCCAIFLSWGFITMLFTTSNSVICAGRSMTWRTISIICTLNTNNWLKVIKKCYYYFDIFQLVGWFFMHWMEAYVGCPLRHTHATLHHTPYTFYLLHTHLYLMQAAWKCLFFLVSKKSQLGLCLLWLGSVGNFGQNSCMHCHGLSVHYWRNPNSTRRTTQFRVLIDFFLNSKSTSVPDRQPACTRNTRKKLLIIQICWFCRLSLN